MATTQFTVCITWSAAKSKTKMVTEGATVTDSARFELFSFWRASATYRARVAFNIKGVFIRERNVYINTGEQRSAEFLKINPM